MLGPFFSRDRADAKISAEKWSRLVSDTDYSEVATDKFAELSIVVRTRWFGHDREDNSPPRIFTTKAMGDSTVSEINSATELEALAAHESLCARYREQVALLQDGGAPLLTDGVL